jgi:cell division protein FtsW (lipid II flippase)
MITSLYKSLQDWKLRTDGRQQLQHSYLAVTLGLVLAAGIIGLINYDLGQRILLGAFICIVVFVANAVAWALLQSFVLMRIDDVQKPNPKPTRKK